MLSGRRRRAAEDRAQAVAGRERQRPVRGSQRGPAAGQERAEKGQRVGQREQRRRVVRAGPQELELEARAVDALRARAVAGHERVHAGLTVAPHVEEGRALGRAQPLVAVARVVGRAEGGQVELDHAGRVRAVDEHVDAAPLQSLDEARDGQHQARRARDVVDERQARGRRHPREQRFDDLFRIAQREGQRRAHDARAARLRHRVGRVAAGRVGRVGDEQLVAGAQLERAQHGVDAGRGVGHEDEVGRVGAHEGRQRRARRLELRLEFPHHKTYGLALEPGPPALLAVEDGRWTRAEGTMVQETDCRVQRPRRARAGAIRRRRRQRARRLHVGRVRDRHRADLEAQRVRRA
jgi:hypothetical protein